LNPFRAQSSDNPPANRCPAGFRRLHTIETKAGKVLLFDDNIDYTYRIVHGNVVVQQPGQQRALSSILAFDQALHVASALMRY
jgi:hypothetical protein